MHKTSVLEDRALQSSPVNCTLERHTHNVHKISVFEYQCNPYLSKCTMCQCAQNTIVFLTCQLHLSDSLRLPPSSPPPRRTRGFPSLERENNQEQKSLSPLLSTFVSLSQTSRVQPGITIRLWEIISSKKHSSEELQP